MTFMDEENERLYSLDDAVSEAVQNARRKRLSARLAEEIKLIQIATMYPYMSPEAKANLL